MKSSVGSIAAVTTPLTLKSSVLSDRDSGVFMSDSEVAWPMQATRPSSAPIRHQISTTPSSTPQKTEATIHRLVRPAELNLGVQTPLASSKPKSELQLRHDLIRNSQTQSKAALLSPTQLLNNRLGLTSQEVTVEGDANKIRAFTPPKPLINGCILPGPRSQMVPFHSSSLRARTEKDDRPAWWCKTDRIVIFDGVEELASGEMKFKTRTSKGLTLARRRGESEMIVVPLNCKHCQDMLKRMSWRYTERVCKRAVCWDCKERCKWELEQERIASAECASLASAEERLEVNRERADSVLQNETETSMENLVKLGIEHASERTMESMCP